MLTGIIMYWCASYEFKAGCPDSISWSTGKHFMRRSSRLSLIKTIMNKLNQLYQKYVVSNNECSKHEEFVVLQMRKL